MKACLIVLMSAITVFPWVESVMATETNLHGGGKILLVVPEDPSALEKYAIAELAKHVEQLTGTAPETAREDAIDTGNQIVIGQAQNNRAIRRLIEGEFLKGSKSEQGYSMRVDRNPHDKQGRSWLAVLCGTDPQGVLYAVRDFSHYYFYLDNARVVLRPASVELAPRLKLRGLSESGCNLFSAKNDRDGFMHTVTLNYFSEDVVFDKQYYVDWLSEWKINFISLLWCNNPAYDGARHDVVKYAHARGIQVLGFFVPYRPSHEKPPASVSKVDPMSEQGDCPRDPLVRKWYFDRLAQLVTQEPKPDMIQIESPYHDGVYCHCPVCRGTKNPYPEDKLLEEMVEVVRKCRPEIPIVRGMKRPVPDEAAAKQLAEQLKKLEGPNDWHLNSYPNAEYRRRWHDLGPKFATYLRPFRELLKGADVARDIDLLFDHFRTSAERDIVAHQFCYRFYAGRFGSFPVEQDRQMLDKYPDRKGPFSLALVAEAAFDPFVRERERAEKIRRMYAITIPDYPAGRSLADKEFERVGSPEAVPTLPAGPVVEDPAAHPPPSKLFRYQWGIRDPGFTLAEVCADLDGDGQREIVYASRTTQRVSLLRAADGSVIWSVPIPGNQESAMAYDLDGDGRLEIIYTTSSPGRLYVLDSRSGKILKQWDSGDWKLGNSAAILDGDGDGVLDGYFGSRSHCLFRLNMRDLVTIGKRTGWSQCGCYTSALDVDGDGRWDLFAGSGDDRRGAKGVLHRYDPITLESLWSFKTDDNAASADPVLVDIDGDGKVEIIKSVDNYAGDDAHDAVYAFDVDGTLLWKVDGLSGEDSPNVADLDGDGQVEIVGMTFGSEVYCLDAKGRIKWRRDLRPELDNRAHAYMAPILCDLNGDRQMEILAMTNGGWPGSKIEGNGVLFALSAEGQILDRFDLGKMRYWGEASVVNVDDDPEMELVISGLGGLDVIETKGFGPNSEYFQRRRDYRRLNVVPWVYEDTYFIYRGKRENVVHLADSLVLAKEAGGHRPSGKFTTELLTLPPDCRFTSLQYAATVPAGTELRVNIQDKAGRPLVENAKSEIPLKLSDPVRLEFLFRTSNPSVSPRLDSYRLSFDVAGASGE